MTKKSIFPLLRLLMILFFAEFPLLRGDITVYKNLQLRTERSGGADYAQLRLAARRIEALLRREKGKLPGGKTMVILSDARQIQLKCASRSWVLLCPGSVKLWKKDFQLRRQLYGAILAARLEITPQNNAPQLSEWLTAAIDQSIDNSQKAELYLSGNNTFFSAAQFFRRCGHLPDFARLCTMKADILAPGSRAAYGEFSLLLAELLAKRKLLKGQIRDDLDGKAPDAWAEKFTGGAQKRQSSLEKDAWHIVWNRRQPLPPALIEERIAPLAEFAIPEIDEKGNYTGKTLFCSHTAAAQQLANRNRKDAAALRRSFAVPWNELAQECDQESRNLCRKIAAPITLFGIDPKAPEEFAAALDSLKKHLAIRRKKEALLNRTEGEKLPLPRLFDQQLESVKSGNPALTTPEKIFLELSERDYLAE